MKIKIVKRYRVLHEDFGVESSAPMTKKAAKAYIATTLKANPHQLLRMEKVFTGKVKLSKKERANRNRNVSELDQPIANSAH